MVVYQGRVLENINAGLFRGHGTFYPPSKTKAPVPFGTGAFFANIPSVITVVTLYPKHVQHHWCLVHPQPRYSRYDFEHR